MYCSFTFTKISFSTYCVYIFHCMFCKTKRKRSDSDLCQKPLHSQISSKSKMRKQKRHENIQLHNHCVLTYAGIVETIWGTCKLRNGKKRKETKRNGKKKKNEKKTRRKVTKRNEKKRNAKKRKQNSENRNETKEKEKKRKKRKETKRNEKYGSP